MAVDVLPPPPVLTTHGDKNALRSLTRTCYDAQKIRIMLGNRVAGHFRAQLGQAPGMSIDELSEEAQGILRTLRAEYAKFADAVVRSDLRRWQKALDESTGIIRSPYDLALARLYLQMEDNEERAQRDIQALVRVFPIWGWLESVRGVGPMMAAVLITELDPYKAPRPSCFWSYCGLDAVPEYQRPELAVHWKRHDDGTLGLMGGGRGFGVRDDLGDECVLVGRVVRGPAAVSAHIRDIDSGEATAAAGVIARESDDPHAPFCAALMTSDMRLLVCVRDEYGTTPTTQEINGTYSAPYLRLNCASGLCHVLCSDDGVYYQTASSAQLTPSVEQGRWTTTLLGCCALASMNVEGQDVQSAFNPQATPLRAGVEGLTFTRSDGTPVFAEGDDALFSYDVGDAPGYIQGRGRSRRAEHLVKRSYINRKGEAAERNSITFNLFLKTKVVGVLGSNFVRLGGHYREIYDDYKHRVESHPRYGLASADPGATKLHRHNMAVRYACKMFLLDLWREWRRQEGLPVYGSYAEEKLGLVHEGERWGQLAGE